jgi:hypothetical protein
MKRFAGTPDIFTHGVHADTPLRVYAVVAGRERRVWGPAAPYWRLMVGDNPAIENEDEGTRLLLLSDGQTRHPWPVETSWKLWKRRQLRRDSTEIHHFRLQQKAMGGTLRVRGYVKRFDPEEGPTSPERARP